MLYNYAINVLEIRINTMKKNLIKYAVAGLFSIISFGYTFDAYGTEAKESTESEADKTAAVPKIGKVKIPEALLGTSADTDTVKPVKETVPPMNKVEIPGPIATQINAISENGKRIESSFREHEHRNLTTIANLKYSNEVKSQEIAEKEGEIRKLKSDLAGLKQQNASQVIVIKENEEKISTLSGELDKSNKSLNKANRTGSKQGSTISRLTQENKELSDKLTGLETELATARESEKLAKETSQTSQNALRRKDKEAKDYAQKLSDEKRKNTTLTAELSAAKIECEQSRQKANKAEEKVLALKEKNLVIKERINTVKSTIKRVQTSEGEILKKVKGPLAARAKTNIDDLNTANSDCDEAMKNINDIKSEDEALLSSESSETMTNPNPDEDEVKEEGTNEDKESTSKESSQINEEPSAEAVKA